MAGRHYTLAKLVKQDGCMNHSLFRYQAIKIIIFSKRQRIWIFSYNGESQGIDKVLY